MMSEPSLNTSQKKPKKSARRHNARANIVQALYQLQFNCHSSTEVLYQFMQEQNPSSVDRSYFESLFTNICKNMNEIDNTIKPTLDRSLQSLNPTELAILRLAVFELMQCLDVPYRVVINEAIELAKDFGATEGYKYINGVLDKLAPSLRQNEIKK